MEKNVFVIIVSYNGEYWLKKNLQSLAESSYPVKILVVDNHSSDDSVAIVKSFPEVHLLANNENLGFGRANNLGIKNALAQSADYVFLLNQDAWVFPETIGRLVRAAEKYEDYGIISPIHYSGDGVTLDKNFEAFRRRKTPTSDKTMEMVPFVNAAAWLIPTEAVERVGFFEPLFAHYGEDRNFTSRVLFHNYKIGLLTTAKICHDRVVKRCFTKDVTQSKYKILTEVLDVNSSLFKAYWKGFLNVFGLPKYFKKDYSFSALGKLFWTLALYYLGLFVHLNRIIRKRRSYK